MKLFICLFLASFNLLIGTTRQVTVGADLFFSKEYASLLNQNKSG